MRFFNTAGPCQGDRHYMLAPQVRLPDLMPFIQQQQYFVLHAARQTGKTTAMLAFAEQLRADGVAAVYTTLETTQGLDRVEDAEPLWLDRIVQDGRFVIELKRTFKTGKSPQKVREQGTRQLAGYLDTLGESEGWLLIFDQRDEKTWDQRLWQEDLVVDGKTLHLRGA